MFFPIIFRSFSSHLTASVGQLLDKSLLSANGERERGKGERESGKRVLPARCRPPGGPALAPGCKRSSILLQSHHSSTPRTSAATSDPQRRRKRTGWHPLPHRKSRKHTQQHAQTHRQEKGVRLPHFFIIWRLHLNFFWSFLGRISASNPLPNLLTDTLEYLLCQTHIISSSGRIGII